MENKLKSVLSGTGFYVLLTICLAVAGVSGYLLLFSGDRAEEAPPPAPVSVPVEDVYVPEPEETGEEEEPLRFRWRWKSFRSCRRRRWTTHR